MKSITMKRTAKLLSVAALAASAAIWSGACDEKKTTAQQDTAAPAAGAPTTPAASAPAAVSSTPTAPASGAAASTPPTRPAVAIAIPAESATPAAAAGAGGTGIDNPVAPAGECNMLCLTNHRNSVSLEKNPPTDWDVKTGKNILWSGLLGSKSYGNPIVNQGIVTVGTNNEGHRDPNNQVDGGVEMAFDEATGKFLWQKWYSKLPTGRVNDWPYEGLCATGYAESGRLWYCTNQCHVTCLDLSPGAQKLPDGSPPVIWDYDMIGKLGVFPHNMTASSIAAYGDLIYVITGNGVDDTHKHLPAPKAPGIVCFDKNTGKVVWTDNSPGENVLHGQWSSVAIVEINGRAIVIAPLGDAWVYAYDAKTGKIIWKFDTNPKDGVYPQTRNEVISAPCIWGKYMYIGNGQDPEHGEGQAHMYCVDITGEGDVSEELDANPNAAKPKASDELVTDADKPQAPKGKPNPNSKVVWHFDVAHHPGKVSRAEHMNRTISTAVVTPDGLCFVPDFSGFLHCFDAKTGENYWNYDLESEIWGSPLYIDGKIYVSDGNSEIQIFKASKAAPKKDEVIVRDVGSPSYCSPVVVNGVLYVVTRDHVIAIKDGVQGQPLKASEAVPKSE